MTQLNSEVKLEEVERLQAFIDAYNRYPISVMEGIPDPRLIEQQDDRHTLLDDSEH